LLKLRIGRGIFRKDFPHYSGFGIKARKSVMEKAGKILRSGQKTSLHPGKTTV